MARVAASFAVALACFAAFAPAPARADSGPVIVIPSRPGVPVVINGRDASYAVVEDWGLSAPSGAGQITVIGGSPLVPNEVYRRQIYILRNTAARPERGRNEVEPAADRALPDPAESFSRSWSTSSDVTPANDAAAIVQPFAAAGPRHGAGDHHRPANLSSESHPAGDHRSTTPAPSLKKFPSGHRGLPRRNPDAAHENDNRSPRCPAALGRAGRISGADRNASLRRSRVFRRFRRLPEVVEPPAAIMQPPGSRRRAPGGRGERRGAEARARHRSLPMAAVGDATRARATGAKSRPDNACEPMRLAPRYKAPAAPTWPPPPAPVRVTNPAGRARPLGAPVVARIRPTCWATNQSRLPESSSWSPACSTEPGARST